MTKSHMISKWKISEGARVAALTANFQLRNKRNKNCVVVAASKLSTLLDIPIRSVWLGVEILTIMTTRYIMASYSCQGTEIADTATVSMSNISTKKGKTNGNNHRT